MNVVLFEDGEHKNLFPLVYFRPVWELRCGALTLAEKIQQYFPEQQVSLLARQYLMDYYLEDATKFSFASGGDTLFVNGRLLLNLGNADNLLAFPPKSGLIDSGQIAAFRMAANLAEPFFEDGVLNNSKVEQNVSLSENQFDWIKYPWDLIDRNPGQIAADFALQIPLPKIAGKMDTGVQVLNSGNIHIAATARVMPGVVLNAESGPIWIDEGAAVMPQAYLEGPVYVGKNSKIKVGAKIYEGTSIGPVCKIGGEVEECIIQGYSNKQHDGFLGHSYLGSWVNIGADTNNSDLKNTYGEITVHLNGHPVNTGKQFVGLIMGDHSKTAINTMFNTGTIVGVNCNVYGAGFPPKFIPSFAMGGSGGFREYHFEKALEVAAVVMGRRKIEFSGKHRKLFEAVKLSAYQTENRARIQ